MRKGIGSRNYSAPTSGDVMSKLVKQQGKTRGRNPRPIEYPQLDVPTASVKEFAEVTGITSEQELCELLYVGFNEDSYSKASDEIGEFIPDSWDKQTSDQFRLAVRNTVKLTNLTVEQVVDMLKPAIEKALADKATPVVAPA